MKSIKQTSKSNQNFVFVKSAPSAISAFTSEKFMKDITKVQMRLYYESTSTADAECPVIFLKIYFDFAYYLLLSPFRIVVSEETGKFIIKKNKLQQFGCGILQLLCTIRLLTDVRDTLQLNFSKGKQTPIQYFEIVENISSFIYKMETMRRFWFCQEDYLRIFNCVQDSSHLQSQPYPKVGFIIGYFADLCILSCAIPLWLISRSFAVAVAGKNVVQHLGDYDEGRN
ncbi:unnamed protein product [Orchesella dallaii]|uniref:Uncharacterized protein n=1 Tax=Orchesella dallaii TaxID=48710 RepID=A0ABP1PR22_9HEXA